MRHDDPELLEALDLTWDDETGFLGRLRGGEFVQELADAYIELLGEVDPVEDEVINSSFVKLLWFMPIFIEWQIERVVEAGTPREDVERVLDLATTRIMDILGVP
ncbi:hypothetical protein [Nonomuraea glycinis]|uniref:hypothetical protein n=1 Tax=Nonomuraea glycinis TaxID=2047744 RepID=UPI002E1149D4|nr:hypothetical protein OHA68_00705 [Nonomuraea glycinis]